jgi:hypothetical protein
MRIWLPTTPFLYARDLLVKQSPSYYSSATLRIRPTGLIPSEETRTDTHASSGIRIYDPSV